MTITPEEYWADWDEKQEQLEAFGWEALAELSLRVRQRKAAIPPGQSYNLTHQKAEVQTLLTRRADQAGVQSSPERVLRIDQALADVFAEASSMGLLHSLTRDDASWIAGDGRSQPRYDKRIDPDKFRFSRKGLQVLGDNRSPILFGQGHFERHLDALIANDGLALSPAQRELLLEAQRCILQRCYRAAVILIGLTIEGQIDALIIELETWCKAAATTDTIWGKNKMGARDISVRFAAALDAVDRVRNEMLATTRTPALPEPSKNLWKYTGSEMRPLAEAIREARNAGAHAPSRIFSADTAIVLLFGAPHVLLQLSRLIDYLKNKPDGAIPTF